MVHTLTPAFTGYDDAIDQVVRARSLVIREKPKPSRTSVENYGRALDAVERSVQVLLRDIDSNRNELHKARLRVSQMLRENY